MTPAVISALFAGLAVVISAVFTGLVQLQHNRSMHSQSGKPYPAAGQSQSGSPDGQQ